MESLINRLRRTGFLLLIGFFLIVYTAFGALYVQQEPRQRELEEQIAKLNLTLSKSLPSVEKLQAEYDEVNQALSPISAEAALDLLVSIASENGIEVGLYDSKLNIPPARIEKATVGKGTYQVLSFRNIKAEGDHDSVMAFISALDSGETLKTMVLKKVSTSQIEFESEGEEGVTMKTVAFLDVDIYTKLESGVL